MNLTKIDPILTELENHPVFTKLNSLKELRLFMEHHVFAVWDFMSLLKKLQELYAPHGSPWVPNSNGNVVRFINEIVTEEESDKAYDDLGNSYISHFEIYLNAMKEVGASTNSIENFIYELNSSNLENAFSICDIPIPSMQFMRHTFGLIEQGKGHEIAASFAIGRESIVPVMFKRILKLTNIGRKDAPVFHYYLERHAHLDGEHHGPMAFKLLDDLCSNDTEKENEAVLQLEISLLERIKLWDGVILASEANSSLAS